MKKFKQYCMKDIIDMDLPCPEGRWVNEEHFDTQTDDQIAESFINMDTWEWFYYAINELGEKGSLLKTIHKDKKLIKYEFNVSSNNEPKIYVFIGRISKDLLHVTFNRKGDRSLKILNDLSRTESFSLIGSLSNCIFECFRFNKEIKRVVFLASNNKMIKLHDTMSKWIPKKYKELKFNHKDGGSTPSYWYDRVQLTKEDFRYIRKTVC